MEAPAGQVIQDKVRVWPICVRVAATVILHSPVLMNWGRGTLGGLSATAGLGGEPCFTAVVVPQQSKVKDSPDTHPQQCHKQQPH